MVQIKAIENDDLLPLCGLLERLRLLGPPEAVGAIAQWLQWQWCILGAQAPIVALPSEDGTTYKVLRAFAGRPGLDSSLNCLTCATFAVSCVPGLSVGGVR